MDKEDVVCIYNGILAVKRNEIFPFATIWQELKDIMLSEIRGQKLYDLHVES